jgi:hypothetical protein
MAEGSAIHHEELRMPPSPPRLRAGCCPKPLIVPGIITMVLCICVSVGFLIAMGIITPVNTRPSILFLLGMFVPLGLFQVLGGFIFCGAREANCNIGLDD